MCWHLRQHSLAIYGLRGCCEVGTRTIGRGESQKGATQTSGTQRGRSCSLIQAFETTGTEGKRILQQESCRKVLQKKTPLPTCTGTAPSGSETSPGSGSGNSCESQETNNSTDSMCPAVSI